MRVLFAVSNNENNNEDIVDIICNEYQKQYKKIISYKRVFYYDAIVNEIRQTRDNQYDRIIISEDFEKSINDSYESEDLNLYKHLDEITDEAYKDDGTAIPIILLGSDRRSERDPILSKLFILGIYNILLGRERTIQNVCALIERPRSKKIAKIQYNLDPSNLKYASVNNESIINNRELLSILRFFSVNKSNTDKCVRGFAKISREYTDEQIQLIISKLPLDVRIILEDNSKEYFRYAKVSVKQSISENQQNTVVTRDLNKESGVNESGVIIPNQTNRRGIFRKLNGQK